MQQSHWRAWIVWIFKHWRVVIYILLVQRHVDVAAVGAISCCHHQVVDVRQGLEVIGRSSHSRCGQADLTRAGVDLEPAIAVATADAVAQRGASIGISRLNRADHIGIAAVLVIVKCIRRNWRAWIVWIFKHWRVVIYILLVQRHVDVAAVGAISCCHHQVVDVRQGLEVIGRSSHSRCGQADLTRAGVDLEPAIAVATADAVAQRGASIGISRLNRADHIGIAAVLVIVKCIRRNWRAWIVWIFKHWRVVIYILLVQRHVDVAAVGAISCCHHQVVDVRQGLEVIGRSSHSRCGQADLTRAGVDLEPAIAVATADAVAQRGASIGISRLNRADHIGIAAVLVIVKCIRRNWRAWIVWIFKHWRVVIYILLVQRHVDVAAVGAISCCHHQVVDVRQGLEVIGRSSHSRCGQADLTRAGVDLEPAIAVATADAVAQRGASIGISRLNRADHIGIAAVLVIVKCIRRNWRAWIVWIFKHWRVVIYILLVQRHVDVAAVGAISCCHHQVVDVRQGLEVIGRSSHSRCGQADLTRAGVDLEPAIAVATADAVAQRGASIGISRLNRADHIGIAAVLVIVKCIRRNWRAWIVWIFKHWRVVIYILLVQRHVDVAAVGAISCCHHQVVDVRQGLEVIGRSSHSRCGQADLTRAGVDLEPAIAVATADAVAQRGASIGISRLNRADHIGIAAVLVIVKCIRRNWRAWIVWIFKHWRVVIYILLVQRHVDVAAVGAISCCHHQVVDVRQGLEVIGRSSHSRCGQADLTRAGVDLEPAIAVATADAVAQRGASIGISRLNRADHIGIAAVLVIVKCIRRNWRAWIVWIFKHWRVVIYILLVQRHVDVAAVGAISCCHHQVVDVRQGLEVIGRSSHSRCGQADLTRAGVDLEPAIAVATADAVAQRGASIGISRLNRADHIGIAAVLVIVKCIRRNWRAWIVWIFKHWRVVIYILLVQRHVDVAAVGAISCCHHQVVDVRQGLEVIGRSSHSRCGQADLTRAGVDLEPAIAVATADAVAQRGASIGISRLNRADHIGIAAVLVIVKCIRRNWRAWIVWIFKHWRVVIYILLVQRHVDVAAVGAISCCHHQVVDVRQGLEVIGRSSHSRCGQADLTRAGVDLEPAIAVATADAVAQRGASIGISRLNRADHIGIAAVLVIVKCIRRNWRAWIVWIFKHWRVVIYILLVQRHVDVAAVGAISCCHHQVVDVRQGLEVIGRSSHSRCGQADLTRAGVDLEPAIAVATADAVAQRGASIGISRLNRADHIGIAAVLVIVKCIRRNWRAWIVWIFKHWRVVIYILLVQRHVDVAAVGAISCCHHQVVDVRQGLEVIGRSSHSRCGQADLTRAGVDLEPAIAVATADAVAQRGASIGISRLNRADHIGIAAVLVIVKCIRRNWRAWIVWIFKHWRVVIYILLVQRHVDVAAVGAISCCHHQVVDVRQGLEVIGRSSHSRCGQADLTRAGVDLEPAIAVATADAVAQRGASIGISRLNRADHIGIAAVLVIVKCIRRNWRAWIVWIFKHWRVVIYILLVQRHVDVAAVGAISCCHHQVVDVRQGLEVIGRSSHSRCGQADLTRAGVDLEPAIAVATADAVAQRGASIGISRLNRADHIGIAAVLVIVKCIRRNWRAWIVWIFKHWRVVIYILLVQRHVDVAAVGAISCCHHQVVDVRQGLEVIGRSSHSRCGQADLTRAGVDLEPAIAVATADAVAQRGASIGISRLNRADHIGIAAVLVIVKCIRRNWRAWIVWIFKHWRVVIYILLVQRHVDVAAVGAISCCHHQVVDVRQGLEVIGRSSHSRCGQADLTRAGVDLEPAIAVATADAVAQRGASIGISRLNRADHIGIAAVLVIVKCIRRNWRAWIVWIFKHWRVVIYILLVQRHVDVAAVGAISCCHHQVVDVRQGLEVIGRSSHSRCGQADLTRAGVDLEPAIAVATADAVAQRGASIGISRLNRADHIGIAAVLVIVKCIRRNWRAWIVWIFKHWRVVIYILLVQRHVDVAAVGAISCCHHQVVDVRQGLEVIGRSSHSRCGQADLTRAGVDLEPAIAVATADAVAQRGASIGISRLNRADHIGIAAVLVIVKCIRRNWRAWIVWIFKHWRVVIYILLVQRHVDVAAVGAISCCHHQVVDVRQGLEVIGRSSHSRCGQADLTRAGVDLEPAIAVATADAVAQRGASIGISRLNRADHIGIAAVLVIVKCIRRNWRAWIVWIFKHWRVVIYILLVQRHVDVAAVGAISCCHHQVVDVRQGLEVIGRSSHSRCGQADLTRAGVDLEPAIAVATADAVAQRGASIGISRLNRADHIGIAAVLVIVKCIRRNWRAWIVWIFKHWRVVIYILLVQRHVDVAAVGAISCCHHQVVDVRQGLEVIGRSSHSRCGQADLTRAGVDLEPAIAVATADAVAQRGASIGISRLNRADHIGIAAVLVIVKCIRRNWRAWIVWIFKHWRVVIYILLVQRHVDVAAVGAISCCHHQVVDVRQGLEVIGRSSHSRCGQADLTRAGVDLEPAIAVATADAVAQRGASIGISRLNRADHIGIAAVLVIVKCIRRNWRAWIVWIFKHWRVVIYILLVQRHVDVAAVGAISCCHHQVVDVRQGLEVIGRSSHSRCGQADLTRAGVDLEPAIAVATADAVAQRGASIGISRLNRADHIGIAAVLVIVKCIRRNWRAWIVWIFKHWRVVIYILLVQRHVDVAAVGAISCCHHQVVDVRQGLEVIGRSSHSRCGQADLTRAGVDLEPAIAVATADAVAQRGASIGISRLNRADHIGIAAVLVIVKCIRRNWRAWIVWIFKHWRVVIYILLVQRHVDVAAVGAISCCHHQVVDVRQGLEVIGRSSHSRCGQADLTRAGVDLEPAIAVATADAVAQRGASIGISRLNRADHIGIAAVLVIVKCIRRNWRAWIVWIFKHWRVVIYILLVQRHVDVAAVGAISCCHHQVVDVRQGLEVIGRSSHSRCGQADLTRAGVDLEPAIAVATADAVAQRGASIGISRLNRADHIGIAAVLVIVKCIRRNWRAWIVWIFKHWRVVIYILLVQRHVDVAAVGAISCCHHQVVDVRQGLEVIGRSSHSRCGQADLTRAGVDLEPAIAVATADAVAQRGASIGISRLNRADHIGIAAVLVIVKCIRRNWRAWIVWIFKHWRVVIYILLVQRHVDVAAVGAISCCHHQVVDVRQGLEVIGRSSHSRCGQADLTRAGVDLEPAIAVATADAVAQRGASIGISRLNRADHIGIAAVLVIVKCIRRNWRAWIVWIFKHWRVVIYILLVQRHVDVAAVGAISCCHHQVVDVRQGLEVIGRSSHSRCGQADLTRAGVDLEPAIAVATADAVAQRGASIGISRLNRADHIGIAAVLVIVKCIRRNWRAWIVWIFKHWRVVIYILLVQRHVDVAAVGAISCCHHQVVDVRQGLEVIGRSSHSRCGQADLTRAGVDLEPAIAVATADAVAQRGASIGISRLNRADHIGIAAVLVIVKCIRRNWRAWIVWIFKHWRVVIYILFIQGHVDVDCRCIGHDTIAVGHGIGEAVRGGF